MSVSRFLWNSQLYVQKGYNESRERTKNGLVAENWSQTDGRVDRRTDRETKRREDLEKKKKKRSFLRRNERLLHHKSDFIFVWNDLYFTNLYWKNGRTQNSIQIIPTKTRKSPDEITFL
jgi:Zn-finger nucleic acid-binding protein